ncbi:MAG: MFS transporter [Puniceicoccaceae bacterium]
MKQDIPKSELRGYGILALPLAVAGLPLYLHAPDFYVTERGVSLGLLGIVLMLVRVIDAVQDPLIGGLSDLHTAHRKWIILAGIFGLGLGMTALFTPPENSGAGWFVVWVVISATAFSLVSINLNTLGGIWSQDKHQRTRIASVRERFALMGVTIGVVIPGILMLQMDKVSAFAWFVSGLCVILAFSGWRFFLWARAHPGVFGHRGKSNFSFQLFRFPADKRVRRLLVITLMGTLASSLPAVLFLFFVRDRLMAEQWAWLYLVIYFVAAVVGIPLWRDLSKSRGKVRVWCYTMIIATISFTGALMVGELDYILYGIVCIATGIALGGDLVFPSALLADYVGDSEEHMESASAGFAWLSFIQKAALGLGAGIAFPVLEILGFESGNTNPGIAVAGLVGLYAGIPLVLKLVAIILAWRSADLLEGETNNEEIYSGCDRRDAGDGTDTQWMQQSYEN